ncbi:MAG: response regulator [Proteobacteria bacterium]|nr:response regulator [Pseudomonadota bacterium]
MPNILIVDDDSRIVERLSALLNSLGHQSVFLLEAEFLFHMLEKKRVDLILMAIDMPGINGLSLLKRLKAHDVYRTIPVIMLTRDSDEKRLLECVEAGAIDFIEKPIRKRGLRIRLQLALNILKTNETRRGKNESHQYYAPGKVDRTRKGDQQSVRTKRFYFRRLRCPHNRL